MYPLHPTLASIAAWPLPGDPARVPRELERLAAAGQDTATPLPPALLDQGNSALSAIFGNSPFLSDCVVRDPGHAMTLFAEGPDAALALAQRERDAAVSELPDSATLMTVLRRWRRRVALTVALADIAGLWALERITATLSDCAESALRCTVDHLLREFIAQGHLPAPADPAEPSRGCGFTIIGMGKLGARELNYSSDIDLIALYDDERIAAADPSNLQKIFVRLTRRLVQIMEERTAEGYVARTDLRLRPDPAATPLALSMTAAEIYYESLGQNWERAAMIKARPVAGDLAAGAEFMQRLVPYVWRRNLDFAAIQDIHSIKRQIDTHRGHGKIALNGHDVKIGRGGIREIEFFAQTQQLIWGGRFPALRARATCDALTALSAAGRIDAEVEHDMIAAYRYLRRVEHRLQMINDHQTHALPEADEDLAAVATFLGYRSRAEFSDEFLSVLRTVEGHYARLFEDAPPLGGPGSLVFTGTDDDPGTLETLRKLGFQDVSMVARTVRGWHHGRYRAMRSARARELLTELMPTLLEALGRTPQPDAAFLHFDAFLGRLPAGVALFSLFHANPGLLELVAEVMGSAPLLAEQLTRHTPLLDAVLSAGYFDSLPAQASLAEDLSRALALARDFQDVLDVVRRWKNERVFQVGVQFLRARIDATQSGAALTAIAESAIATLLPAVETEFARQHGMIRGGVFAAVALGKLGSREMTLTSDLDLVFLYDAPNGVDASDGERPLPVSQYYIRLSNRLINAITAATGEGSLYEVDMRLRPSGTKGPIAVSLAGFAAYHRDSAWTWEHMALTRARPITGPEEFRARVGAAIGAILRRPRDPAALAGDVAGMRALMARENRQPSDWNVKHRRGGLIDIEFIAQFLQLRDGAAHPDALAVETREALRRARDADRIDYQDGDRLIAALDLWQTVQAVLRLAGNPDFDPASAPLGIAQLLVRSTRAIDFVGLTATLSETAARVRAIFERLLPPESAKPPRLDADQDGS
jgi:glutamate-ammonia-ligase adenylyltransferase